MTEFKTINPGEDISLCRNIRIAVFCDEQGYSQEEEFDLLDDISTHVLMHIDGVPVGTGRVYKEQDGRYKLGRIAVLQEYRGKNYGYAIVRQMIHIARKAGAKHFKISAQTYAQGFYEKLGFQKIGDEYLEGHVPHIAMEMPD